ncbi:MAG: outer membrane lipoprotein-sorting protein [Myxococcota bacterium]
MLNKIYTATALALLLVATSAQGGELTGVDIAKMAEENNSFAMDNASATVKMEIVTTRGVSRERVIESKMKRDGKGTKKFIRFLEPPDVKGTAFLSLEEKGKETEQRLYLPAIKTDRRIRSNQKNESFMGTDFTYRDMEGRDIEKATHTRLPDDKVGGIDCYVVESVPKEPEEEGYSRFVIYVGKETKVPIRIKFYDRKGKEFKVLTVKKLNKVEGRWVATESEMVNLQENSYTKLYIQKISFDEKIDDEVFTRRNLQRG